MLVGNVLFSNKSKCTASELFAVIFAGGVTAVILRNCLTCIV